MTTNAIRIPEGWMVTFPPRTWGRPRRSSNETPRVGIKRASTAASVPGTISSQGFKNTMPTHHAMRSSQRVRVTQILRLPGGLNEPLARSLASSWTGLAALPPCGSARGRLRRGLGSDTARSLHPFQHSVKTKIWRPAGPVAALRLRFSRPQPTLAGISRSRRWPARLPAAQLARQGAQGVEVLVGHALLERDDPVVGDVDVLGADLGAALGDVAHAHAGLALQQRQPVQ